MKDRVDDRSMRHGRRHEQSRQAVRRQPLLVRSAGHPPDRSRPSGRPQAGGKRPEGEDRQSGQSDVAEAVPKRSLVGIRRGGDERHVRDQQQHPSDRSAAVPERDAVESTERSLDRRQQRCEDERAGEQQDCLGAAQLAKEPAARFAARAGREPEHDVAHRDCGQYGHAQTSRARGAHLVPRSHDSALRPGQPADGLSSGGTCCWMSIVCRDRGGERCSSTRWCRCFRIA